MPTTLFETVVLHNTDYVAPGPRYAALAAPTNYLGKVTSLIQSVRTKKESRESSLQSIRTSRETPKTDLTQLKSLHISPSSTLAHLQQNPHTPDVSHNSTISHNGTISHNSTTAAMWAVSLNCIVTFSRLTQSFCVSGFS
ncbi:hypothetical protein, unlikely [Trypanosoma congolense IL3000]|uniref:Uncharacterized protein n=1 Tax=Trypanosoma congolense (strain IL3000) TaxID=1068625 RepID=F9W544_TRYCI|nr:hypothetical protein, unlikely [Trypanosoma congolense IL3000]